MKAAVLYGKEDVRVEEVKEQPLAAGEARVQIEAALTCGTDLKVYRRGYHAKMIVPPAVFGHELSGVISELGPETPGWRVGDRVVAANSAPCDACYYCERGQHNLCDDLLFLNGAYAESIVIPPRIVRKNLLKLRPGTSFADAALTEPLACVAQGVDELKLQNGETVLILGAGPIGLMFVALARQAGCHVVVAGRGDGRLQAAKALGASQVIDVGRDEEMAAQIKAGQDKPFDVVIEAVGKPFTWEVAVRLARKGGRVNFFGGCPSGTTVSLDTALLHYSSIALLASFHHTPRTIRRALELIETGAISSSHFITGTADLNDLPELFRGMASGGRGIKTLIRPRAPSPTSSGKSQ